MEPCSLLLLPRGSPGEGRARALVTMRAPSVGDSHREWRGSERDQVGVELLTASQTQVPTWGLAKPALTALTRWCEQSPETVVRMWIWDGPHHKH